MNAVPEKIDKAIQNGMQAVRHQPNSYLAKLHGSATESSSNDQGAEAPAVAWPEPDPFEIPDDRKGMAVPVWAFPRSLRRTIARICAVKQVTPETPLAAMLGLLSAVCAGRYSAKLAEQYLSHAHVWILMSLRSSGGKSEVVALLEKAIKKAEKILQRRVRESNDENGPERARVRKRIEALEAGAEEDEPGELVRQRHRLDQIEEQPIPRFTRKGVSPQKLDVLLAKHQRVAIVDAESAEWLSLIMGDGAKPEYLSPCLSGYSVEPHGSDRITREESMAQRPVFSLLLCAQEHVFRNLAFNTVARSRGLVGRCMVFKSRSLVGSRKAYDERPNDVDMDGWQRVIDTVCSEEPETDEDGWVPLSITVAEDAKRLYSRLFSAFESRLGEDSPDLQLSEVEDVAGRALEQIGRLAILLHVAWEAERGNKPSDMVMSESTVFRAFTVLLWSLSGFLEMTSSRSGHQRALELWNTMREHPLLKTGVCTVKDWQRSGPNKWRSAAVLEPELNRLEELGYIQLTSRKNPRGPDSRLIVRNPHHAAKPPATVATVATLTENPIYKEIIRSHPHLATVCDGSDDDNPGHTVANGRTASSVGINGVNKGFESNGATVATVAGQAPVTGSPTRELSWSQQADAEYEAIQEVL